MPERRRRARIPAIAWSALALGVALQIGYPLTDGPVRSDLSVAIVVAMAAAATLGIAATYGIARAAAACALSVGIGFVAEAIGTSTGYPFGSYEYTGGLGPRIGDVPVVVGLAWAMGALPAAAAAARLARHSGWARRTAIAAAGLAAWDLFLDPQMVADGRWRWADASIHLPAVPGVPLSNYAGWALVSCAVCGAVTTVLGARPLAAPGPPAAFPAPAEAQFLWVYASSILAHAAFLDLPGSAAWGALGMGAVAVPLVVVICRDVAAARATPGVRGIAAHPDAAVTRTAP